METRTDERSAAAWRWPVAANAMILIGWVCAAAWLAIPRYDLCPAIYPAPAGCGAEARLSSALIAALVLVIGFLASTWAMRRATTAGWVRWLLVAAFLLVALVSYRVVVYA